MALARGLVDSPPERSESLRALRRLERRLLRSWAAKRATPALMDALQAENEAAQLEDEALDEDECEMRGADLAAAADELWALLLDVVFSPLRLRVRAAALLGVCFLARPEAPRAPAGNARWIRAVVSSTCQALEELQPTKTEDARQLFAWLGFLEGALADAPSRQFAPLTGHSMYSGMLAKMVRLLGACSTEVFAATTVCLARFHALERQCLPPGRSVLVADVLARPAVTDDGKQHVGGALLHVINSCGCPCPEERLETLHNCIQLLIDVMAHPQARNLLFLNDFKVLIDITLREVTDLPPEHESRVHYLEMLERGLASPAFRESQCYRRREILDALESLLEDGSHEDSRLPQECVDIARRLVIEYIDLLD